jgi:hypothetical protein
MATSTAQVINTLDKYADTTVVFREFPTKGVVRYNQPHLAIFKNGALSHSEQVLFNGVMYQADLVRTPMVKGDRLDVVTGWDSKETRDGSFQVRTVIATYIFT